MATFLRTFKSSQSKQLWMLSATNRQTVAITTAVWQLERSKKLWKKRLENRYRSLSWKEAGIGTHVLFT